MAQIGSELKHDTVLKKNEASFKTLLDSVAALAAEVRLGGGNKAIDEHRKRGKLTARERIGKLTDPDTRFLEIGLLLGAWDATKNTAGRRRPAP